jgi:hypothetical protein
MNMSATRLRRHEAGRVRIAARTLLDFAAALDVPIGYFFATLSCEDVPARASSAFDEATRELLDAFEAVSNPRVRERFAALVRAIAQRHALARRSGGTVRKFSRASVHTGLPFEDESLQG